MPMETPPQEPEVTKTSADINADMPDVFATEATTPPTPAPEVADATPGTRAVSVTRFGIRILPSLSSIRHAGVPRSCLTPSRFMQPHRPNHDATPAIATLLGNGSV